MIDFRNNAFTTKGDKITIASKDGTTTTMPRARYQKFVNTTWIGTLINAGMIGFCGGVLAATRSERRNSLPPVKTRRRRKKKKTSSWSLSIFGCKVAEKKAGPSASIFRGGSLL